MNKKKLAIAIPTRNRPTQLINTIKLLNLAILELSEFQMNNVEIVIGDNSTNDETKKAIDACGYKVQYFKHKKNYDSAEGSLYATLSNINSEYVWTLSDDDFPQRNCLVELFDKIEKYQPSYIMLNCDYILPDNSRLKHLRINAEVAEYDEGWKLFNDFGLCNIGAAIYCAVFRLDELSRRLFNELYEVSRIYSHSFALLGSFYNKKAIFINQPLIVALLNKKEDEEQSIQNVTKQVSNYNYYAWHLGILKLAQTLSLTTNLKVNQILHFNEPVVSKADFTVHYCSLKQFMKQYFIGAEKCEITKAQSVKLDKEIIKFEKNFFERDNFWKKNLAKKRDKMIIVGFGSDGVVASSASKYHNIVSKKILLATNSVYKITNLKSLIFNIFGPRIGDFIIKMIRIVRSLKK